MVVATVLLTLSPLRLIGGGGGGEAGSRSRSYNKNVRILYRLL